MTNGLVRVAEQCFCPVNLTPSGAENDRQSKVGVLKVGGGNGETFLRRGGGVDGAQGKRVACFRVWISTLKFVKVHHDGGGFSSNGFEECAGDAESLGYIPP